MSNVPELSSFKKNLAFETCNIPIVAIYFILFTQIILKSFHDNFLGLSLKKSHFTDLNESVKWLF